MVHILAIQIHIMHVFTIRKRYLPSPAWVEVYLHVYNTHENDRGTYTLWVFFIAINIQSIHLFLPQKPQLRMTPPLLFVWDIYAYFSDSGNFLLLHTKDERTQCLPLHGYNMPISLTKVM